MKKYPFILFFHENLDDIENVLKGSDLDCTLFFVKSVEELEKMYNPSYQLLVTYGPDESRFGCGKIIAERMSSRWIHFKEINDIAEFNRSVNYCFIHNCFMDREKTRPQFSIFTTCYNSYDKIVRAYNSVKSQTFLDYEWVILDDSADNEHFAFLKDLFRNDSRVRLYDRARNSGNIGNVKNEAVSLCRGKYVLELDHDDEILPDVILTSFKYFENNPDTGFIYMDFANVHENGSNYNYGDFICKGYGSYYTQYYNGRWIYVYNTPRINNITLSHLVCCPNHPRIWKRSVLLEAGNYSEFLPICDDYEIILRTSLITKMAKISTLGYIQYVNENNNNFSYIRNSEINRIGPNFINLIYRDRISERMKDLDAHEDPFYLDNHSKIWKRLDYTPKFANRTLSGYQKQVAIIGIENIPETFEENTDYILLDTLPIEELWEHLTTKELLFFKCYSLPTRQELKNYFLMVYLCCEDFQIIGHYGLDYNTDLSARHHVINKNVKVNNVYLEIGVEYGITLNGVICEDKTGVDPDPKCENVVKMTSNQFFENNQKLFDVIFIDGMHQSGFAKDDFNNSLKFLNNNGLIILDDILPLNESEQLKIPKNHIYENGILKYNDCPWTGDIWKLVYHLLQFYAENFMFGYYNHENYRGMGLFRIKKRFVIENTEELEKLYDYQTDFKDYLNLIQNYTTGPLFLVNV